MRKEKIVVQCRGPGESDWSNLSSFSIDQRPGVGEDEAAANARKSALREASIWQRNYDRLADHEFRIAAV